MSRLVFGVVITSCLVSITAVPAATYYLAPDGNDTHPGTKTRPWQSLRFAAGKVVPGDVVKLKPGVYRQTTLVKDCKGTAKQPILFEADGGQVTLDASIVVTGWRHEGQARYSATVGNRLIYTVWAKGRMLLGPSFHYSGAYAKVKYTPATLRRGQCLVANGRLHVRLFDDSDPAKANVQISHGHCLLLQRTHHTVWRGIGTAWGLNGYKLEFGSSHNLFTDAELRFHAQGVLETGKYSKYLASHHNTFQRLHIHHVGLNHFEHGIYTDGVDTSILNCRFDHISGAAIHAYPRPLRGIYDGNRISDPWPDWNPQHFVGQNPPDAKGYYSAIICWGRGGHRLTNNLIAGPFTNGISVRANDCRFVNNTLVLTNGLGWFLDAGNCQLANNVTQTQGDYLSSDGPLALDHNGYHGGKSWRIGKTTHTTFAALQAAGNERHGVEADPGFVNTKAGTFSLAPDSPLRDIGSAKIAPRTDIDGTKRPEGKRVDLGAYEAAAESNRVRRPVRPPTR
jgi:hypothetical protein